MQYLSFAVSTVALALSALTYLRGRRRTQLENDQIAAVRVLAARAVVLWNRTVIFASAQSDHYEVDSYQKFAARLDAEGVREQLDVVIGLGLLGRIISDRPHALTMYQAFSAGLAYQATLDVEAPSEEWTKQHMLMGLVRLLETLLDWRPNVLPRTIETDLRATFSGISNEAWTYLEAGAGSRVE